MRPVTSLFRHLTRVMLTLLVAPAAGAATTQQPAPADARFNLQVVTIDALAGACPSNAEVTEALNARIPGLTIGASDPASPGAPAVRLTLTHNGPGALRVELIDPRGLVALERTLQVMAPDSPPRRGERRNTLGCAALADTVSLIVDRYLRHMDYRDETAATQTAALSTEIPPLTTVPPPASGVRAVLIGAGADLSGAVGQARGTLAFAEYASLSLALHWQRLAVTGSAGVGTSTQSVIPQTDAGSFKYVPAPARLAAGVRIPLRTTVLIPALGAGADLLFTSTQNVRGGHLEVAVDPVAEAGCGYLIPIGGRAFFNAHAWGVLNLRPHDFLVNGREAPVLRVPRFYVRAGLQVVFQFDGGDPHASAQSR